MSDLNVENIEEIEAGLDAIEAGLDELDDLDLELEAEEADVEEIVEPDESDEDLAAADEVSEDPIDDELSEVDAAMQAADDLEDLDLTPEDESAIERLESYEAQEADGADLDVEAKADPEPKAKRTKRAGGTSRAKPKDLALMDVEAFVLDKGDAPADMEANRKAVIAKRPVQVKVGTKFDGIFATISAGSKLDRYTGDAFKFLHDKKAFTQSELRAHYEKSVKPGTAASQSGQIMNLFVATGIAERDGKSLKLRENSLVAEKLAAFLGL